MPADFWHPGPLELYVQPRKVNECLYLGTCVTAPLIDATFLHDDLISDATGSAPWQKVEGSEQHIVTATLNRVNFQTFNHIRTGSPNPGVRKPHVGSLVLNVHDFRLLIRNSHHGVVGAAAFPEGAWAGRLYYSSTLMTYRESTDTTRTKEITIMLECNPLYVRTSGDRGLYLYTEDPYHFPPFKPE